MKKTPLMLAAVLTLMFITVLISAQPATKDAVGTWQLVSTKYGDAKEFSDVPKDERHVKMLTATHFIWVIYDGKTNLVSTSMGGSYTLHNGKYTETVEFFLPKEMEGYLGKKQEFTLKIDGDKFFQSGTLSDGTKIEEVWQRIK
jgi:hypothetical protein